MKVVALCFICILGGIHATAQELINVDGRTGAVLLQDDLKVLDHPQPRNDHACAVTIVEPGLDFDLRLHSGYDVSLPVRELAGEAAGLLVVIARVTPENPVGRPVFLSQHFRMPALENQTRGRARLIGTFALGTGRYRVDWLLRDARGHVCSSHWRLKAKPPGKDGQTRLRVDPGNVEPEDSNPHVASPAAGSLRVRILANIEPRADGANLPGDPQYVAMSMLRQIAREPRIGHFSLVAFSLEGEQVLFRQPDSPGIDFAGLQKALSARTAGTIDVRRLEVKNSAAELLKSLIAEGGEHDGAVDAVIIAGPKATFSEELSPEPIKLLRTLPYPVFYLNYNMDPYRDPWGDVISKAVRLLKGHEYSIKQPLDVWSAWRDIMAHMPAPGSGLSAAAR